MNAGIQKDFEGIVIQKNALTGQSNELHLSSFLSLPRLVSLAAAFLDVTQRSLKRKDWSTVA